MPEINGINYPNFLFKRPNHAAADDYLFAAFDPALVGSKNSFQPSSAPNLELTKKTLIISDEAFRQGYSSYFIACYLHVLKKDGFMVNMALKQEDSEDPYLVEIDDDFEFIDCDSVKKNIFSANVDLKKRLFSVRSKNPDEYPASLQKFRDQLALNADSDLILDWKQSDELEIIFTRYEYFPRSIANNSKYFLFQSPFCLFYKKSEGASEKIFLNIFIENLIKESPELLKEIMSSLDVNGIEAVLKELDSTLTLELFKIIKIADILRDDEVDLGKKEKLESEYSPEGLVLKLNNDLLNSAFGQFLNSNESFNKENIDSFLKGQILPLNYLLKNHLPKEKLEDLFANIKKTFDEASFPIKTIISLYVAIYLDESFDKSKFTDYLKTDKGKEEIDNLFKDSDSRNLISSFFYNITYSSNIFYEYSDVNCLKDLYLNPKIFNAALGFNAECQSNYDIKFAKFFYNFLFETKFKEFANLDKSQKTLFLTPENSKKLFELLMDDYRNNPEIPILRSHNYYLNILVQNMLEIDFMNFVLSDEELLKNLDMFSPYDEKIYKIFFQSDDKRFLDAVNRIEKIRDFLFYNGGFKFSPEMQESLLLLGTQKQIHEKLVSPEYVREQPHVFRRDSPKREKSVFRKISTRSSATILSLSCKDDVKENLESLLQNSDIKVKVLEFDAINTNTIHNLNNIFSALKETLKFVRYQSADQEALKELENNYPSIEFARGDSTLNYVLQTEFSKISPTSTLIKVNSVDTIASPEASGKNEIFTMVCVGEQWRPFSLRGYVFYTRNSNLHLKIDNNSLDQNWMPILYDEESDFQKLSSTATEIQLIIQKEQFDNLIQKEIENFKTDDSITLACFDHDISGENVVNNLLSFSPDNKILAIYCSDPSAEISYRRNDDGFYFVKSDKACQIKYLILGNELTRFDILADLDNSDLSDETLKILNEYKQKGDDHGGFKFEISDDDVELPQYKPNGDIKSYNKEWLKKLFAKPNSSSCRHRVMAVASEFEDSGLELNKDFRILSVNNNHVILEVKNKLDQWVVVDLGGSHGEEIKAEPSVRYNATISYSTNLPEFLTFEAEKLQKSEQPTSLSCSSALYYGLIKCFGFGVDKATSITSADDTIYISTTPLISPSPNISSSQSINSDDDKISDSQIDFNLPAVFARKIPAITLLPKLISAPLSPSADPLKALVSASLPTHPQALTKLSSAELVSSDLASMMTDFLNKSDKKSLLLQTSSNQQLINYLIVSQSLRQQAEKVDDANSITDLAQNLTNSPAIFLVRSPQDLSKSVLTITIQNQEIDPTQSLRVEDSKLSKFKALASNNSKLQRFILDAKTQEEALIAAQQNQLQDRKKSLSTSDLSMIAPKVLLIDWAQFSDKEKVAFNTIFDITRKIDDLEIPSSVKIICVDSSGAKSCDESINSRFSASYNLIASSVELAKQTNLLIKQRQQKNLKVLPQIEEYGGVWESSAPTSEIIASQDNVPESLEKITIDLSGYSNWQGQLFGHISLEKDQLSWQKSQFVEALENGCKKFTIKNIDDNAKKSLEAMIETAKAFGYFDYYGYIVAIDGDLQINFAREKFEFADILSGFVGDFSESLTSQQSSVPQLAIYQNIVLISSKLTTKYKNADKVFDLIIGDIANDNIEIINSLNFDKLLKVPKLDQLNQYYDEEGLIARAAKKADKTLKLLISSELSQQQYYCLLARAKEYNVNLQLYLADGIRLPIIASNIAKFNVNLSKRFDDQIALQAEISDQSVSLNQAAAKIIITNNPNIVLSNLLKSSTFILSSQSSPPLIINAEDIVIGDLLGIIDRNTRLEKTGAKLSPDSVGDDEVLKFIFSKKTSEFYSELKKGRQVVIKGKFSEQLLQNLQLIMVGIDDLELQYLQPDFQVSFEKPSQKAFQARSLSPIFGNLTLIIENEEVQLLNYISKTSKTADLIDPDSLGKTESASALNISKPKIAALQFLHQDSLFYEYHRPTKTKGIIIKEQIQPNHHQISRTQDIEQSCSEFIQARKKLLATELFEENHQAVALISAAGSGKTVLMEEIENNGLQNKGDVKIFKELDNLPSWAVSQEDGNPEQLKILVIDEFNIDGTRHYTTFSDFVQGLTKSIFYQGREYQLSSQHKILFLGNPLNYGDRYEQKLFVDCDITQIELQNFPADYVYQEILKKPIYDALITESSNLISEEQFRKICQDKITGYYQEIQSHEDQFSTQDENFSQQANAKKQLVAKTVRKLQEQVLIELATIIEGQQSKELDFDFVKTKDFVVSDVNKATIEQIQQVITVRNLQHQKILPNCSGTPAIIFEGEAGIGKSVMIEAILKANNIEQINNLEEILPTQENTSRKYYKILASFKTKEIEQALIKAFELGVIVVFDEINARIDEGLEKIINSLLTNKHPTKKADQIQIQPGFMLISSINSANSAGRANLSPAILSRSHYIKGKSIQDYQAADFEKILLNWYKSDKKIQQQQLSEKILAVFAGVYEEDMVKIVSALYAGSIMSAREKADHMETKEFLIENLSKELIVALAKQCEQNKSNQGFNLRTLRHQYLEILKHKIPEKMPQLIIETAQTLQEQTFRKDLKVSERI